MDSSLAERCKPTIGQVIYMFAEISGRSRTGGIAPAERHAVESRAGKRLPFSEVPGAEVRLHSPPVSTHLQDVSFIMKQVRRSVQL